MTLPLLCIEHGTLRYGNRDRAALDAVEVRVAHGEFLAITGPSGAGKSSLLNVLGLLDTLSSGRYLINGQDVAEYSEPQRNELRTAFGFVFQAAHVLPERTVAENVGLPLMLRGEHPSVTSTRVTEVLVEVGLADLASVRASLLSGGERQRLAIARAIVGDPLIVFADEPTGNLDRANSGAILNLLEGLNSRGVTIVLVTHDSEIAARAHRTIRVIDGAIASENPSPMPRAPTQQVRTAWHPSHSHRRAFSAQLHDALASVLSRPLRTAVILLSFIVGAGALCAAAGTSHAAALQVEKQITAAALDTLYLIPAEGSTAEDLERLLSQARSVSHVKSAALRVDLAAADARLGILPPLHGSRETSSIPVAAVDAAYLEHVLDLSPPQAWRLDKPGTASYAIIGADAAARLGVSGPAPGAVLWALDRPHQVVAILSDTGEAADDIVFLNHAGELASASSAVHAAIVVSTATGYPAPVSDLLRQILGPAAAVTTAADLEPLRLGVVDDLSALIAITGSLVLALAAFSAAGILTLSVHTRTGEIALRRAIGTSRLRIGGTFLVEGLILGVLGGAAGTVGGIYAVLGICALRGWVPHLSPDIIVVGLASGIVTALLASTVPALRASFIDPAQGLRH